jgi:predicted oxidoreductase
MLFLYMCPGVDPDYSAEAVRRSIQSSLQRLGVAYIDILHCHDIEFCADMRQVGAACARCTGTSRCRLTNAHCCQPTNLKPLCHSERT